MIRSDKTRLFQLILQDEFKLKHRVNFAKTKILRFDGDSCMGMYEGEKISPKKYPNKPYAIREGNRCVWVSMGLVEMYFIVNNGTITDIQVD